MSSTRGALYCKRFSLFRRERRHQPQTQISAQECCLAKARKGVQGSIYLCDLRPAKKKRHYAILKYVYSLYETYNLSTRKDPRRLAGSLKSCSARFAADCTEVRYRITEAEVKDGGLIYFLLCVESSGDVRPVGRFYVNLEDFFLHPTFKELKKLLEAEREAGGSKFNIGLAVQPAQIFS